MRRTATRLLLLALLTVAPLSMARAAERVMVGYLATFGSLPVEEVPWSKLTHVCHAFLRVSPDGELVRTDAMPNAALTAEGRKRGVPVLLTIGGGRTLAGLERATADQESIEALAGQAIEVVADGLYDGIDLGWQFPRDKATRKAHAALVLELRQRLDALAKESGRDSRPLLTVAVSPSPYFGEWVDIAKIAPVVDWFGVAAYDMSGPWSRHAGHHAPLFASSDDPEADTRSVSAAMAYWESRGVPKKKLVMGVPMFGRSMPVGEPHAELDPDESSRHRALPFSAVRGLVGEGWLAKWDNESRAPWLVKPTPKSDAPTSPLAPIAPDAEGSSEIIGYDDRNSVDAKATWAGEQGYGGLYFRFLHQDRMPDKTHWLLNAANAAWPAE